MPQPGAWLSSRIVSTYLSSLAGSEQTNIHCRLVVWFDYPQPGVCQVDAYTVVGKKLCSEFFFWYILKTYTRMYNSCSSKERLGMMIVWRLSRKIIRTSPWCAKYEICAQEFTHKHKEVLNFCIFMFMFPGFVCVCLFSLGLVICVFLCGLGGVVE